MTPVLAVLLSVLAVLSILRRMMEPACPECASKHWADHPTALHCADCGWTNVAAAPAAAPPPPAPEAPQGQYEICFR